MARSRYLFCLGMAGVCGTSAFAGLAYTLEPGQADKAVAGGALTGAGCLAAVSAVWAVGRIVRRRADRPEPGAA